MKISKQERILIVVFLVAAIIGVGIFVFILPNFNKISDNNKQLASVNKQYADINKQLEHESTIDNEISQAYEDGKNLADKFFNDLTEYEADEIMRKFIANGKDITIDGLTISPFSTQALSVSVFSPTEVTYPLKDFANTVVETPDKETDFSKLSTRELVMYAKKLQATLLAASEPVTVGSVTVAFTAHSNKLQNLHDFADLLYSGVYEKNGDGKTVSIGMPESRTIRPVKELRGFEKVELEPGEEKTVTFTLAKRAFAYYRTDISDWYVESGDYTIMAAKSSRDIACTATVNVTSTTQIKRVYTMNSTIEEIMESPVGREILGKMMAQNPLAQADADDIGMGEAMARMMAEMPLRALLSFGGDSVPAGAGEMLLKQLNA